MNRLTRSLILGVAGLLLSQLEAGAAVRKFRNARLDWIPTTQLSELSWVNLAGLGARTIELRPFTDERNRTDRIGEYRTDQPDVWPISSDTDVAAWVTAGVRATLERVGLRLVDRDGDIVLHGAVRHFLVTERGTYEGEVSLYLVAEPGRGAGAGEQASAGGRPFWSGLVLGTHTGSGRFDRDRGWSETLSNTVFDAVVRLLRDSEFTIALSEPADIDCEE